MARVIVASFSTSALQRDYEARTGKRKEVKAIALAAASCGGRNVRLHVLVIERSQIIVNRRLALRFMYDYDSHA